MKGTIVTGSLIVFSDGFVWKRLSNEKAYKIWVSAENEDFELYKVRVDDESESLIESLEDLQAAFKQVISVSPRRRALLISYSE